MFEKSINIGDVKITIKNYSLNTINAKKYGIKTIGDDGIYDNLHYMRKLMPRGLSFVEFTNEEDKTETVVFFGFRKFSGMEDDDEKIDNDKVNNYFREGTMADVTHFIETEKSNGENAKWTIRNIFGKNWVFAGSKNTCKVFLLNEDPRKWYPINSIEDYGNIIAFEVYNILNNLKEAGKLDEFVDYITKNEFIIMGELNHPDSEHIFPILTLKIEHVALLGKNGIEINPVTSFNFFDKFELPSVSNSLKLISEFGNTTKRVLEDTKSEGSVDYLLKKNNDGTYIVLALQKRKSSYYVVIRRIRENCRRHFKLLHEYPGIDKNMVIGLAKKCLTELEKKLRDLTFLPNYTEMCEKWVKMGVQFVNWWFSNYIKSSLEEKMKLLELEKTKFGTTFDTFVKNGVTNYSLDDEKMEEEVETIQKMYILRGPSGSGKTYTSSQLVNLNTIVVSADDYFEENGRYNAKQLQEAHASCQKKAFEALLEGKSVIVSNTNIQLWEMISYVRMSKLLKINVVIKNIDSFLDKNTPIDWMNKNNADYTAKILSARTKGRDKWREEIPVPVIVNQIKRFEDGNVSDIMMAKPPKYINSGSSVPNIGAYKCGGYIGFSHPVFIDWVMEAAEKLSKNNEHNDIMKCLVKVMERDNFIKHITLGFGLSEDKQKDLLNKVCHLSLKDFKNVGIGAVDDKNGNRAYYIVVKCIRLEEIYKTLGMENKYPTLHITIGFRTVDIHNVSKGVETLLKL